tara:strand:+ start:88 stop:249 length:162 start_codon:yes stop_codon:yes gene_type:complete
MQLELFFTAYDFYGTMDNTKFPKASEDYTASPFNKQGYMYCSDYKGNDWRELH